MNSGRSYLITAVNAQPEIQILNVIYYKDIMRLACLKWLSRHFGIEITSVTEDIKWLYDMKMEQMEELYLNEKGIILNKVKEGGGNTNTG